MKTHKENSQTAALRKAIKFLELALKDLGYDEQMIRLLEESGCLQQKLKWEKTS